MNKKVPKGWKIGKFSDLAKVTNGYAFQSSDFVEKTSTSLPVIKMNSLKRGHIDLSNAVYVKRETVKELEKFLLTRGDFVFGMSGSISNFAVIKKKDGACYQNQRVGRLSPLNSSSEFVSQLFISESVTQQIKSLAAGGAQMNISSNQIENLEILNPPIEEQKKIASILTSVDELIEKTQSKIDKLRDLKKATMYEFFINYIAKTGLKDNRKSFLLSNLVSRIRTIENNEVKNILTISSTRGWLDQSERWSRKMAGESLKKYTKLKKGDFSYNRGNSKTFPYGCIFRMDKWDEAVVPNVYHSFEITNTQVDSNYLQQYFWSGALDKQLRKVLTSSARDDGLLNITADTFFSLNVDLPSLSEQKKVASILTSMDKNIDDKKQKLTQIQFLKKSLMQDLLTGKVRVKVN